MVIVTGGIDLSVGSVLGFSSLITAICFGYGFSTPVAVFAGLFVGFLFGACNGILITVVGLQPFIATLGTLSIGRGLIYIITHGMPLTPPTPSGFAFIGQGYVGFVPVPVIILFIMTAGFSIVMRKTRFGRYIYAVGGNEQAARYSGVRTRAIKFYVYTLSGLVTGLAGVVSFSRYLSAEPGAGIGGELDVIGTMDSRSDRLAELSVLEQVSALRDTPIVRDAERENLILEWDFGVPEEEVGLA